MRILILLALLFTFGCVSAFTQVPPPVADNANPQDRSIKDRSIDMERVKRDENKGVVTGKPGEAMPESKFNQIKEDFEQLQLSQNSIVDAYSKTKEIDYTLISRAAGEVGKRGTRLSENLFPPQLQKEAKKKKKEFKEPPSNVETAPQRPVPDDIKTLITEIDNTLVLFVANPMFSNSRVINTADQADAKSKLEHIVRLSGKLQELAAAKIGGAR